MYRDFFLDRRLFSGLFSTIILLHISTSCLGQNDRTDFFDKSEMERNEIIIRTKFEQWKENGTNFFDLLVKNVEWTVAGKGPLSKTFYGKEDFLKNAVQPVLEKLKTEITPELINITSKKEVVWLNWKGRAITLSGSTYENHYAWMITMRNDSIIKVTAFLDTHELYKLINIQNTKMKTIEETKEYIGMWVTEDGYIRHELLPNNRYDEARGNRKSAYQGSYVVKGNLINYKDDTGFVADGQFINGILYHAGMVLYKEEESKPAKQVNK